MTTRARLRLGLLPAPCIDVSALSDKLVSKADSAATSTIRQCSSSAPMADSSCSCWPHSTMHQHHLSPTGWTPSKRSSGTRAFSSTEAAAGEQALAARPVEAAVRPNVKRKRSSGPREATFEVDGGGASFNFGTGAGLGWEGHGTGSFGGGGMDFF